MDPASLQHQKNKGRTYLGELRTLISSQEMEMLYEATVRMTKEHRPTLDPYCFAKQLMRVDVFRIDVPTVLGGQANSGWIAIHHLLWEAKPGDFVGKVDLWAERVSVIRHELAHVLDRWLFKGNGHGKTWKLCALAYQDNAERCHSLSREFLKKAHPRMDSTSFTYLFEGCSHQITVPRRIVGRHFWRTCTICGGIDRVRLLSVT